MEDATTSSIHEVVILGSGPAGLTAAIYAARANLSPVVIEGKDPGGQLMITTDVENFPGFRNGVMGPSLMEEMREQAKHVGTQFISGHVDRVELSAQPFVLHTGDAAIRTKTLIIATGASARWLGLPEESPAPNGLYGMGLSACATCDGFFFRGKDVIVVGGGDTALEEATFLTRMVNKVYLIHRRDALRASKPLQARAFNDPKIEFIWNKVVTAIHDPAAGKVTGVSLTDTVSGATSEMPIDGVFVAIGHTPNTAVFEGALDRDENGYLVTKGTRTTVPGVFACGDVCDSVYRQAITAAGSGCMAAIDAERYLASIEAA
jgi:thioredoxin reductase (NADPH)